MTTAAEVFVDTNVLLAATASARPWHAKALGRLEAGFATRAVALSGQVAREYLVVATRPAGVNGLGLAQADAIANLLQFLARARVLDEDANVRATLLDLLASVPCLGKQVHDANIAATMIAHGVRRLLTLNPQDFRRFEPRIDVSGLE